MKEKWLIPLLKLIKSAAESAATEILKKMFLFIFSTGIIAVLAHITTTQIHFLVQYAIIISISVASGLGYLITTAIQRKRAFDYKIIEKKYEFEYITLTSIKFRKTITIKALTKKCDRLFDRYNWTGSGFAIMTCDNKNFNIMEFPRNDNYQRTEINFGRTLELWETITVVLDYTLDDPLQKAVPFLCSTVIEPTDKQILIVKAPLEWALKDAIIDTRKSAEDHYTENSGTLPFINGICTWEMNNPKFHNVYAIKWDLENKIK